MRNWDLPWPLNIRWVSPPSHRWSLIITYYTVHRPICYLTLFAMNIGCPTYGTYRRFVSNVPPVPIPWDVSRTTVSAPRLTITSATFCHPTRTTIPIRNRVRIRKSPIFGPGWVGWYCWGVHLVGRIITTKPISRMPDDRTVVP